MHNNFEFDFHRRGTVMGKNNFPGSGTTITLSERGTYWIGSNDHASNSNSYVRSSNHDKRPSQKDIDLQSIADDDKQGKLIRSFISQCAMSHTKGKLTHNNPNPPPPIRKLVTNSGGNIKWISSDRVRQSHFHKFFCKHLNEEIHFNQLWSED